MAPTPAITGVVAGALILGCFVAAFGGAHLAVLMAPVAGSGQANAFTPKTQ